MSEPLIGPIPDYPAAIARVDRRGFPERSLVIADYHVGVEAGSRYERGVGLPSEAAVRRECLLSLLNRTDADRLVVLSDPDYRIGDPDGDEAEELRGLVAVMANRTGLMVVPGNHSNGLADFFDDDVEVTNPGGVRLGDVGFCHDHAWPSWGVLAADMVCSTHEHSAVRLEDEVDDARKERVWLCGALTPEVFVGHHEVVPTETAQADAELVVFPAFNGTSDGAWINVPGQGFLSPFLPDGLTDGEAYLLNDMRSGDYRNV